ncbi:MAG: SUMF1/EgtB/PvdO family nonheme iron enzyme, partial [Muribaculaceae bacterium]|nr:SUMF1/EgtB/PvdO family nonheme iron enzyme [Muribaculaceae bacterium]
HIVCRLISFCLIILYGLSTQAQTQSASKKQVAVYVTKSDVEDAVKKIVQSKIISTLTHGSNYRVLERNSEFLEAIQSDRDYGMSGNVKDSQIAAIGKEYGAQFVLVIDISEIFSEIFISARLVNVESGVITATADELIEDPSSAKLMVAAEKVAKGVAGQGGSSASAYGAATSLSGSEVETFTVNGVSFEMVKVEGGSFQMGSYSGANDEQPVHSETVGTFYIGKTEVTQRLWGAVMGTNPSSFRGENLPVENVSWYDCQEFVDRLSRMTGRIFRLPTEAEWEYAAKGGNKSRGYTYSGSNDLYRVAWYTENSGSTTHPVAQKLDNELGIYDMSGNVWEWCSDNYSSNYSSPRNSSIRVGRGGGWRYGAASCRVALRYYNAPGRRSYGIGLRLAL